MDLEIRQFLDECMNKVAEEIRRVRTPEEIEANRIRAIRTEAQIRTNGAAALERLETGQRDAYQKIKHNRYMG